MRRAAGLVITLVGLSVAAPSALRQTFRAGVDLVHFGVVVTDRDGSPISGLTRDDFEIKERGKAQAIRYFAAGNIEEAPPLHIGFLLDTSGSMQADMDDVRTAAIKFLSAVDTAVDVTLVDFDTEVRVARFGRDDYPRLIERIRMRKPDGWTAFYDAFATYLHTASSQTGQKVAVVYTDGGDTRSTLNRSELQDLLKVSDVTVYAIGYLEGHSSSSRMETRAMLSRLAEATGGQALFPASLKEVDRMYEKIQQEIAARYSLGYVSSDPAMDGSWREVEIRLKRSDLRGAKIRTRAGYFAPYRAAASGRR